MMKKSINIFITLLCAAILMLAPFVSRPLEAKAATPTPTAAQTARIEELLKDFITRHPNRISFGTDEKTGERDAAEYIQSVLTTMYSSLISQGAPIEILIEEFEREFTTDQGTLLSSPQTTTRKSQNVILRLGGASHEKIIIGCNYDNNSSTEYNAGALDNGSGVAICLYLAEALRGAALPLTTEIIFFGGGYYGYEGSEAYIENNTITRVSLAVNVSRIGGGQTYVYSSETKTPLERNVLKRGAFSRLPASLPLLDAEFIKGYPYTHYGMLGNQAAFMRRGCVGLNIFGGYYGGLALYDRDGKADLFGKDSIANMEAEYAGCYGKMASVAIMLDSLVRDEGLGELIASAAAVKEPTVLLTAWPAYLILFGIAALGCILFFYLGRGLNKKYPPKTPKKAKIAVFGGQYEDKKDDEVIIEVKPVRKDPFDPFSR